MVEKLIAILFHLRTVKIKATHGEQILLKIKVYLVHDNEGFILLCDIVFFLLKLSVQLLR